LSCFPHADANRFAQAPCISNALQDTGVLHQITVNTSPCKRLWQSLCTSALLFKHAAGHGCVPPEDGAKSMQETMAISLHKRPAFQTRCRALVCFTRRRCQVHAGDYGNLFAQAPCFSNTLQDTGVFHQKTVSKSMQETMATDPTVMVDMMKKNLTGIVPQVRRRCLLCRERGDALSY